MGIPKKLRERSIGQVGEFELDLARYVGTLHSLSI